MTTSEYATIREGKIAHSRGAAGAWRSAGPRTDVVGFGG